jgi:hypothetical protein
VQTQKEPHGKSAEPSPGACELYKQRFQMNFSDEEKAQPIAMQNSL